MGPQKLLMPRAKLSFTKEISRNTDRELKKRPVGCLCLAAVTFLVLIPVSNPRLENIEVDANEVKYWALKFGKSIATSGARATCLAKLTENFNYGSKVEWVSANSMLEDMRVDVQHMLSWKQQAVERIVRVAEDYAAKHEYDKHLKYDYFNMKKLYDPSEPPPEDENRDSDWRSFHLEKHHNFDQFKVNPQYSAMHVPTNVYDKDPEVVNAIKWSEYLTTTFRNNLAVDPALTWQFFCSSTGFLRLFPAMKWPQTEGPDLYDCRMRHWYVQTAASAKDVVILLDGSGSMTGLRKEIARNVVFSILDTLSDNDYLSILRFSDIIEPVVPCFENSLVQANEQNIRELKEHLETLDTRNIANFTLGLVTAFEILQKYNRTGQGSQCNQAIMLITDGAPYTYEEIFRQYNWPNIPVRVFTYLIGREVTDIREVNWMACANRGYYTHVATLAEAREQVEKYIPVMSRPIVLSREHPVLWTAVYAHPATQMLSEWLWEEREQSMMQKILIRETEHHMEQKDSQMVQDGEISNQADNSVSLFKFSNEPLTKVKKKKTVQLMTTVAMPVFHPRNSTVQDAKLLGVAGTDIKVQEIQRLTPAFKLGVNAYAFIITNNGYVLFHPDLRPLFQDLLKPGYSSVDITEVELPNNQLLARELDETLLTIRRNMIDRRLGWETLSVKVHQDNMRRVVTRTNKYYYAPIDKTPFSLAIVLPQPYGNHQLYGHVELKGLSHDYGHIFRGKNWRVHPDWVYCEKPPSEAAQNEGPEDYLHRIFKDSISTQNFKWRTSSTAPPIFDQPICEKDLLQSLVFDANATNVNLSQCAMPPKTEEKFEEKVLKMFGMVTTFVATRSGFMRFEDHQTPEERANNTDRPFYDVHTRAFDELFYKRAVDFYSVNSSAFVYSVPFDAGTKRDPLVTASHAIFVSEGEKKAPVAVVGLQIRHSTFVSEFFKETSKCIHKCRYNCSNERLDCYLLDNNGFIIVSEVHSQTGKFFGEVDYTLFDSMINYGIYNRVHLYDYQAICLDIIAPSGPASILMTPFKMFYSTVLWMWGKFALFMLEFNLLSWWGGEWAIASDYYDAYSFSMDDMLPNRTRPRPCDKEIDLYEMQPQSAEEPIKGRLSRCHSSGCDKHFIVQQVPYTNLVMLVVYKDCPCVTTPVKLESKEIQHNETLRCLRMKHSMYRKRPDSCINYHPQEKTIKQCGRGSLVCASIPVLLGALLFQLVRWSL